MYKEDAEEGEEESVQHKGENLSFEEGNLLRDFVIHEAQIETVTRVLLNVVDTEMQEYHENGSRE